VPSKSPNKTPLTADQLAESTELPEWASKDANKMVKAGKGTAEVMAIS
jgi:hypothetical protein